MTLQSLANRYGATRQRIHQIYQSYKTREARAYAKLGAVVYPNLKRFMVENQHSFCSFAKVCGVSMNTIRNVLYGKHKPSPNTQEQILKVTRMTYEEAFKR